MNRELIQRCIAKDEVAWREFVKRFEEVLRLSIRKKFMHLGCHFSEEDIKDISQTVFSEIWHKNKLVGLKKKDKIKSWICIVAQNAAIDFVRKGSARTKGVNSFFDSEGKELDLFNVIPSSVPDPFQNAQESELRDIIDEFLRILPGQQQLILSLNLLYTKTHNEIAQMFNISVNTVSTVIRRTKEKLKKHLRTKGYNGTETGKK